MIRKTSVAVFVLLACAASMPAGPVQEDGLHFGLRKSEPLADASVASPSAVHLWFTEVPQENSARARVIDSNRELVPAGDIEQNDEDPTLFSVALEDTLAPGAYTVAWRGIGDDGHVVEGDFAFTVVAQ